MSPRTTGILFLVAAALGAFVYLYEIRGEEGREREKQQQTRLFPGATAEAVEAIELRSSDGQDVRLVRDDGGEGDGEGGGWRLAEPLGFPADAFAADAMASALAEVAREAEIEDPRPPEVYGLGDAAPVVRFRVDGEEHGLRLGDEAPLGDVRYAARVGSDAVYTVSPLSLNALTKSVEELRDKRVAPFDEAAVTGFTAHWPGGRVRVERDGEGWRLRAPLAGPGDPRSIEDLLSDLRFLRADGFEDAPPPDALAGLAPPDFEIVLDLAPGEEEAAADEAPRQLRIAVGQPREDGFRFVRAAQPSLYRVPVDRLARLPRELSAYRFRQLAEFDSWDATRAELVFQPPALDRSVEPVALRAQKTDGSWSSEPERIDPTKLAGLVRALSNLRARDILAESAGPDELAALGLAPPRVTLRVFGPPEAGEAGEAGDADADAADPAGEAGAGERLRAEVQLGVQRDGGGVVARRPDRETVFELEPEAAEELPVSLEALRARFLLPEEPEEPQPGDAPAEADPLGDPGDPGAPEAQADPGDAAPPA